LHNYQKNQRSKVQELQDDNIFAGDEAKGCGARARV
jgi:hypothetical protein